jgi:hypothetical protein
LAGETEVLGDNLYYKIAAINKQFLYFRTTAEETHYAGEGTFGMAKMAEEAPHSPLPRREEGSSKVTGDNPK